MIRKALNLLSWYFDEDIMRCFHHLDFFLLVSVTNSTNRQAEWLWVCHCPCDL
jgi:hypothetical protein